jgi:hypothetical protein
MSSATLDELLPGLQARVDAQNGSGGTIGQERINQRGGESYIMNPLVNRRCDQVPCIPIAIHPPWLKAWDLMPIGR